MTKLVLIFALLFAAPLKAATMCDFYSAVISFAKAQKELKVPITDVKAPVFEYLGSKGAPNEFILAASAAIELIYLSEKDISMDLKLQCYDTFEPGKHI